MAHAKTSRSTALLLGPVTGIHAAGTFAVIPNHSYAISRIISRPHLHPSNESIVLVICPAEYGSMWNKDHGKLEE